MTWICIAVAVVISVNTGKIAAEEKDEKIERKDSLV